MYLHPTPTTTSGLLLRAATVEDVPAMVAIKQQLRLCANRDGGFLLGASPARYRFLVEHAIVRVALLDTRVVGFSTALPDAVLRVSDVWTRRSEIQWQAFDPTPFLDQPVAYFDQLAVLPGLGTRMAGLLLALQTVDLLFADHAHLMTTTVLEPVCNRRAWPLLARIGATQVGSLTEHYPEVGEIVSAIFHATRAGYRRALDKLWWGASGSRRRLLSSVVAGRD